MVLKRTLDDSAIRRMILPEGFLATDVVLSVLANIADGLHVRVLLLLQIMCGLRFSFIGVA